MILNVIYGELGAWRHPEGEAAIREVISEVLENLKYEDLSAGGVAPGSLARFCLDRRRFNSVNVQNLPEFCIVVAANRATGYGAMVWYTNNKDVISGDAVWISDNLEPPATDPRVVADPHYPLFHSPSSAVPLSRLREALEEFCLGGTGARPATVDWIRGDLSGRRSDKVQAVDFVEVPDDPWAL